VPRLTAYGHSWVEGDGASTPAHRMVDVAARLLGMVPCNRGVGGSSSLQTAALVLRQPPPSSPVYLLVAGLNDARLNGLDAVALDQYAAAVRSVLRSFRAARPDAVTIVLEQPHLLDYSRHTPHNRGSDEVIDIYNARLRDIATAERRVVLAQVSGWDPATMLDEDTVHPNDLGHAVLGEAVAGAYRSSASSMARTSPVHD
jgi:lysophospholipase L1-like esterase